MPEEVFSKVNGMYKRDYMFRMNVMKEIFEIRSCMGILVNNISKSTQLISILCSTVNDNLQGIHTGGEA